MYAIKYSPIRFNCNFAKKDEVSIGDFGGEEQLQTTELAVEWRGGKVN
jgi:hypothetical protein